MQEISQNHSALTLSQQQAYRDILGFIESKHRFFRLSGYAGTGKSFLMVQVIRWLKEKKFHFAVASPTNKAAKNLQLLCQQQEVKVKVTTVAKLLKLQPVINLDTGNQEFLPKNLAIDGLSDYDVVIIDEFSMLNRDNFKAIQEEIGKTKTQVIFVGDDAQLPPVNEKEPIIATSPQIKHSAILSEIVRYEGAIIRVAEQIRSTPQWNSKIYPFETTSDGSITKLSAEQWISIAVEMFVSKEWQENPDLGRILAWRNKTVESFNQTIRQAIYGKDVKEYLVGEILIAKKPAFRGAKRKKTIILNNSEECQVIGAHKTEHNLKLQWDFYKVPVKTDDDNCFELRILTSQCELQRQKKLQELAQQAKETTDYSERKKRWAMFYELDGLFDNVSYAYALTCHKAQGSSLDYVFLAVNDLHYCPDLQKILYTGLTRTKKTCFVC